MKEQDWWTSPLEDDNGQLIMVTGRGDVDDFRRNPRYSIRIGLSMPYEHDASGMPTPQAAELLGQVLESLQKQLDDDPVAIITGVYTGAGRRDIVCYTASTFIFNKKLNAALAHLPLLPLEITAENDPDWEEYSEMRALSEIR